MPAAITIEVTIVLTVERDGWHPSPWGELWGTTEVEHEMRAEVTYRGVNDDPEVVWLDKAAVEDLGLWDNELEGAEEQAIEAGYAALEALGWEDPAIARADHEYDQRRDDALILGGE